MNKIFSVLALLCCIFSLHAQEAPARPERLIYTLQDCLRRGLESNLQLQVTRNDEQAAHNNATLANAGALPTLDATAGYRPSFTASDNYKVKATGEKGSNNSAFDYGLNAGATLNWTLFDGFKIQTNYRQLRLLEQRGETDTRIAAEDLIANIASEYYNYIQQIIRRAHYRYALRLSRERLRISELNYQTGRFSGLDYHLAKVDFNADSAQYVKQQQQVRNSLIKLNQLMSNQNITQWINVPDSSIIVRDDLQLEPLWQQTLDANSSLLRATQNTQYAELDYKKVLSRNYPYLRLNAQYAYNFNHYGNSTYETRDNQTINGGLTVGINIFDGNRRRERRNAQLTIENRKLQRQQLEIDLHANLTTFWQAYSNNLQLLALQQQNLEIAEGNLEIAMERYKLGEISGFDMRQVQKSLLDAEERVLQVQYDAKVCEISLLLISGNIGYYLE